MGAPIVVTITGQGQQLQALVDRLTSSLNRLNQQGARVNLSGSLAASSFRTATLQAGALAGIVSSITSAVIRLGVEIVEGVVNGLKQAVDLGIEFNKQIENAEVGMAAIIATQNKLFDSQGNQLEGQEKFNAALGVSQDLINKLRISVVGFGLPFEPVLEGLFTVLGPLTNARVTLEQIVDLAPKLALGLRSANVPMREIGQETRAILAGTQTRHDRLNQILGITKKEIDQAKQTGTVYELLNERLSQFAQAGTALANTFQGVMERLRGTAQILFGEFTRPLFDSVKVAGNIVINAILDTTKATIRDSLGGLVDIGRQVFAQLGQLLIGFALRFVAALQRVSAFLQENRAEVLEIVGGFTLMVREVGRALGFLIQISAQLTGIGVKTGALSTAVRFVTILIFAQVQAWRFVAGVIAGIGTIITASLIGPLGLLLKGIGAAATAFGAAWGPVVEGVGDNFLGVIADMGKASAGFFVDIIKETKRFAAELGKVGEEIKFPELKVPEIARVEPLIRPTEDKDAEKATKAAKETLSRYYEERFALQTRFLEATGQLEEAHLRELQARYRDFVATALQIGDIAGVRLVNALINVEQLRFRTNQALEEVQRIQSNLQSDLALIERQRQAGLITPNQATQETKRLIEQTREEFTRLIRVLEQANLTLNDKAIADRIRQLRQEVALLGIDLRELEDIFFGLRDALQGPLEQVFNSFADNLISKNRSIVDSFADLARGIVSELARVVRQMLITAATKKLLDEVFSTSLFSGGSRSAIGSILTAAATIPRAFAGGTARIFGPGTDTSDSILARLSRDEAVIPARAARYYGYDFMEALIGMRVEPHLARLSARLPGYADGASRILGPEARSAGASAAAGRAELLIRHDPELVVDSMSGDLGSRWWLRMAQTHRRHLQHAQNRNRGR